MVDEKYPETWKSFVWPFSFESTVQSLVASYGGAEEVKINVKSSEVVGLSSDMKNLINLSLNNTGIKSLDGLPELESLEYLDAKNNEITNGLDVLPVKCPKLIQLKLSGNPICSMRELEPLKHLNKLVDLDLVSCPIAEDPEFRKAVFDTIPTLRRLDGRNRENEECHFEPLTDSEDELEDEEDDDADEENDQSSDKENDSNIIITDDDSSS